MCLLELGLDRQCRALSRLPVEAGVQKHQAVAEGFQSHTGPVEIPVIKLDLRPDTFLDYTDVLDRNRDRGCTREGTWTK